MILFDDDVQVAFERQRPNVREVYKANYSDRKAQFSDFEKALTAAYEVASTDESSFDEVSLYFLTENEAPAYP